MASATKEWQKKYGDVVGYYNGTMPGVILRDLEFIKRVYVQDFQSFAGRTVLSAVSRSLAVNEVRISRVSGEDWRHLKKIMLPAFKTANVKKAVPLVQECVEECFQAMDSKIAGSDGCIDVVEPFCIMATDFGLQFYAGARTNIEQGDASALALYKAARKSVGQFRGSKLFYLSLQSMSTMMSHPLELRTASNTAICIIAGIDNIATPLAFMSYLLSEHQEVQDKVRAEVQALLQKEGMGTVTSEWMKKYGDVVGYYNGVIPGIIIRDLELIKRIYIQDFQNFTGRRVTSAVSKNLAVNEVRISRVSGEDWRHLKKIMLPAFKTANVKKAVPMVQECVEECFRAMDRKLTGSDGCIEVFEPFCIMGTDFGLQFFAGVRTNIQRGDASSLALYKAARKSVGQFGGSKLFYLNLLPPSRLLHKIIFAVQSIFTQLPSDEVIERMLPIINHRRENPDPTKEDLLQLLLNSEKEDRKNNGKIEGKC
ncbi:cytochrome P450 3A43-like [Dermacentor albipictus]|uniref:cytochrome P450 3A43-like n=1 Tax=Dermacentor albipictus TaxID=60249 RepID=UPI0038FC227F